MNNLAPEVAMGERSRHVDVLMASDLRFPGGTTASIVEEITAQARAGYTSGLMHIPSPVQRRTGPFAPRIRRLVDSGEVPLFLTGTVRARVLVVRHPTVLMNLPVLLPTSDVEKVLIVANQVPTDPRARAPYYDVETCTRNAERLTGVEPEWAPIGPRVRESLTPHGANMIEDDWTNIIDVDAWYTPRSGFSSTVPVIGRHSRGHWSKWPATRTELEAAYPPDPRFSVVTLGGAETPKRILGSLPENWTDLPFNSVPPREYLSEVDFLVYYHHPGLIEAFGRTILEGVAAGAVAVVDPSFKDTFGAACLYAPIGEVPRLLQEHLADPQKFLQQSRRGVQHVREHLSYDTHVRRLESLIGPPHPEAQALLSVPEPAPEPLRARALLVDLREDAGAVTASDVLAHAQEKSAAVRLVPASRARDEDGGALVETIPHIAQAMAPAQLRTYVKLRIDEARASSGPISRTLINAPMAQGLRGDDLWAFHTDGSTGVRLEALATKRSRPASHGWLSRVPELLDKHAPGPVVAGGVALKRLLREARKNTMSRLAPGGTYTLVPNPFPAAPPGPFTSPGRPMHLFIATGEEEVREQVERIVERALSSNAFTPVFLTPVTWLDVLGEFGVAVETAITEDLWAGEYHSPWVGYFQTRVENTIRFFRPASSTILPARYHADLLSRELDTAEALCAQQHWHEPQI